MIVPSKIEIEFSKNGIYDSRFCMPVSISLLLRK